MKLVAATRIMNEDDIVEAFVRHHQGQVDHHVFLDNGSADRTVDILRALQAEGAAITVLQNTAPFYTETAYNTNLFTLAAQNLGADWVIFLDTDEFVDARRAPEGLRARIAALPDDVTVLALPSVLYFEHATDDAADLLAPRRMRRRAAAVQPGVTKIALRGALAGAATVEPGQHEASLGGVPIPARLDAALVLAHYYRRGPWQAVWKNTMGRLKVLAAGEAEIGRGRSHHYISVFETLRDAPERLLRDPGWMSPSYAGEEQVDDPIRYDGGPLRYTAPTDGPMKAVRILASYAERLARGHGELADANLGVRLQMEKAAARWVKLF
jgi:hypothetical protein